jgi:hypothetical protein
MISRSPLPVPELPLINIVIGVGGKAGVTSAGGEAGGAAEGAGGVSVSAIVSVGCC